MLDNYTDNSLQNVRAFINNFTGLIEEETRRLDSMRAQVNALRQTHIDIYMVTRVTVIPNKCDACNSARQIVFPAPTGEEVAINCECAIPYKKYIPKRLLCVSIEHKDGNIMLTYMDEQCNRLTIPLPEIKFNDIDSIYFTDKIRCETRCHILNLPSVKMVIVERENKDTNYIEQMKGITGNGTSN